MEQEISREATKEKRIGHEGPWLDYDIDQHRVLRAELMRRTQAADGLLFFPRVRIEALRYPKEPHEVVHTAVFRGSVVDERGMESAIHLFRLEDPCKPDLLPGMTVWDSPTNHLHPTAMSQARFMTSASRMPVVEQRFLYEIFCYKRELKENSVYKRGKAQDDASIYVIVQAFVIDISKRGLEFNFLDKKSTAAQHDAMLAQSFAGSPFRTLQEREVIATLFRLAGNEKRHVDLINWINNYRLVLYYTRCPLLFHLWPQSELLRLTTNAFEDIANALESRAHSLVEFSISWLMPRGCEGLTPLSAERLLHVSHLLACDHDPENLREIIACELFQRGISGARASGHTFVTESQLASEYIGEITREHACITLFHILHPGVRKPKGDFGVVQIQQVISAYRVLSLAAKHKIIQMSSELIAGNPTPVKVLYSYDDWIKQKQLIDFIKLLQNQRFNRQIHADGCTSIAEVLERIRKRRPPSHPKVAGVPRWNDPNFQLEFKRLDRFQQEAVCKAVIEPLTVICGRPGTGKTQVFRTLYFLFGADEVGGVVPFAAYGRIASMLRERLCGSGYTFHRSAGVVRFCKNSAEAVRLRGAATWLFDEGGLVTHHHTSLLISIMGKNCVRLVIAGDPNQMEAIGSGSFFESLAETFEKEHGQPRFSYMKVPHRFITNAAVMGAIERNEKPAAMEDRAIDWNMCQVIAPTLNAESGLFDLACERTARGGARFVLKNGARAGDTRWIRDTISEIFPANKFHTGIEGAREFGKANIQFIAQRHVECEAINRVVYSLFYGDRNEPVPTKSPPLRVGERVCCLVNKYFLREDEDDDNEPQGSNSSRGKTAINDAALERAVLVDQLNGSPNSMPAAAPEEPEIIDVSDMLVMGSEERPEERRGTKRKLEKEQRTATYRGIDSDDMFNGAIKTIQRIVDVDMSSGQVVDSLTSISDDSTRARPPREVATKRYRTSSDTETAMQYLTGGTVERFLVFDDDSQLNITSDYKPQDIVRAYCVTSKRMQGSQSDIIINYMSPSSGYGDEIDLVVSRYVNRKELYTNMTRAVKQFVSVVPTSRTQTHELLEALLVVSRNNPPPRNNTIGKHLIHASKLQ